MIEMSVIIVTMQYCNTQWYENLVYIFKVFDEIHVLKTTNLSKKSYSGNLIPHKIHYFIITFLTKFIFSKSYFTQNSHFEQSIFQVQNAESDWQYISRDLNPWEKFGFSFTLGFLKRNLHPYTYKLIVDKIVNLSKPKIPTLPKKAVAPVPAGLRQRRRRY